MINSFTIPSFSSMIPWTRSLPDIGKSMGMRMVMDTGKGKVADADAHANAHSDTIAVEMWSCRSWSYRYDVVPYSSFQERKFTCSRYHLKWRW